MIFLKIGAITVKALMLTMTAPMIETSALSADCKRHIKIHKLLCSYRVFMVHEICVIFLLHNDYEHSIFRFVARHVLRIRASYCMKTTFPFLKDLTFSMLMCQGTHTPSVGFLIGRKTTRLSQSRESFLDDSQYAWSAMKVDRNTK